MELLRVIPNNPIGVVFDLSYNGKELHPSCCPINVAYWNQRKYANLQPPRYRYQLYDLTKKTLNESGYFMTLYCDILKEEITTIDQLEDFFVWMSTTIMEGLLENTTTTARLWSSTIKLTYRKPKVVFTTHLRKSHQEFLTEYLGGIGSEIQRKTMKEFVVIPV